MRAIIIGFSNYTHRQRNLAGILWNNNCHPSRILKAPVPHFTPTTTHTLHFNDNMSLA